MMINCRYFIELKGNNSGYMLVRICLCDKIKVVITSSSDIQVPLKPSLPDLPHPCMAPSYPHCLQEPVAQRSLSHWPVARAILPVRISNCSWKSERKNKKRNRLDGTEFTCSSPLLVVNLCKSALAHIGHACTASALCFITLEKASVMRTVHE